jgi:hypothetical protein
MLSTTFQDLQIGLVQDTIQTKTFQKQLNLYLYIPPLSRIPSSCFKGLITVEVIHHWIQNSNKKDFMNIATSFINDYYNVVMLWRISFQSYRVLYLTLTAKKLISHINMPHQIPVICYI